MLPKWFERALSVERTMQLLQTFAEMQSYSFIQGFRKLISCFSSKGMQQRCGVMPFLRYYWKFTAGTFKRDVCSNAGEGERALFCVKMDVGVLRGRARYATSAVQGLGVVRAPELFAS